MKRDTRQRFEQWVKNPQCEANAISAVKGIPMGKIAKQEGLEQTKTASPFGMHRGNIDEVLNLPTTWRLPSGEMDLIKNFYEFDFDSSSDKGERQFNLSR